VAQDIIDSASRILVPDSVAPQASRPIRSESRALLVASMARGRRWLDELISDPNANVETIAAREGCSVRKINMTISLTFLAPDLVKAAITSAAWHGRGAPLRTARRMVPASAACSASQRPSLAATFEPSLRAESFTTSGFVQPKLFRSLDQAAIVRSFGQGL
jgi:hypothetical protein